MLYVQLYYFAAKCIKLHNLVIFNDIFENVWPDSLSFSLIILPEWTTLKIIYSPEFFLVSNIRSVVRR